jgi:class 3 adenylate cyclase/tetratricopeptide (TPR) repeat protein
MRCGKCGSDNRKDRKFCAKCGGALQRPCPKCGATNEPGDDFCGDCGGALSTFGAGVPSPPLPSSGIGTRVGAERESGPPTGERRHLTVLFCDLVNSTEIAAQLDPEEWRDLVARYQQVAAEAVARFEGYVAQYLGDGVLALYGYPVAYENDAERAVRTGMEIIDGVAALNAGRDAKGLPALAARVGIHAGPVVVGDSDNKSANVFGDTPNMAARVQAAAECNTVLVSAAVYQLLSGRFVVEDLGAQTLKGITRPVQLYRVIQPSAVRRRTHGTANRPLTPFVGRDEEMRLLLNRWERAREGEGQLALVVGEPGIGKSRLVEEFRARIKDERHTWIECAGDQFSASTPFHVVIQILNQGLRWHGDESKAERVLQLERSLELAGMKLSESVPLIAEILNLLVPEKYHPLTFSPDQRRKRLLASLAGWIFGAAKVQPMVIAMEDLHWVDPSTLELNQILVDQSVTSSLMLLYTARPEFRAPWRMQAHHALFTLSRLNERQTREMVAGVAAGAALAKNVVDAVVDRTDGVPLFAEELTRLMLEGDGRSAEPEIPATLHDLLTARLDGLGAAKEVAQIGAVIGRDFSYELLHAVSPTPDAELQSALAKIADTELVYVRGIPPEATYQFKHALIQEAAYGALLKSRRKELHRRVAETITEKFPALAEAQVQVLAHHRTEGGLVDEAIGDWEKAGRKAIARSAHIEATANLRRALELVHTLPVTQGRESRELGLLITFSTPLAATKGYTDPELEKVINRTRELCSRIGQTPQVFSVLGLLSAIYLNRVELDAALELADQMMRIAQTSKNPRLLIWAHYVMGLCLDAKGDLVSARSHLERAVALYDPGRQGSYGYVQDPGVTGLARLGNVLFALGYPDQALARVEEALALAHKQPDAYSLVWVLCRSFSLNIDRGDADAASATLDEAFPIAIDHGFELHLASLMADRGRLLVKRGEYMEGVAILRESLERLRDQNSLDARWCRLNLAYACGKAGQMQDAFALVAKTEEVGEKSSTRTRDPELDLVKGHLLLWTPGRAQEAEESFRRAIEIARKTGTKAWELRATLSLARLLRDTNRRDEARAMLAEIYNWFTEGFDTADLKDAKALLEELNDLPPEAA